MDPVNNLCKKQGVVVDFMVPVLGRWRQADSLGSLAALAGFMSISDKLVIRGNHSVKMPSPEWPLAKPVLHFD